jgi:NAD(P)-dependent dehydrogenase (short-subunit alcohol dehydrogenase family)
MREQEKQVVLITGASRGIGEATAYYFARQGHPLILTYNTSNECATAVHDACLRLGAPRVHALQLDICSTDSRQRFISQLRECVTRVDILINNAGVLVQKPLSRQSEEEIDHQILTNLSGPIKLVRAVLPFGLRRVVNVASDLSKYGLANFSVYCATKFGLRGFSQALALEGGVQVICVNPDKTGTAMNDGQGRQPDVPAEIIFHAALGAYPVTNGGDVDVRELVER